MVNTSDLLLVVCGCDRLGLFIFSHSPQGCKHSLCSYQSRQCKFNFKMRENKSENVAVIVFTYAQDENNWQDIPCAKLYRTFE